MKKIKIAGIKLTQHHKVAAAAKTSRVINLLFRHLMLVGLSFVILYPLMYMISNAFMHPAQINDPSVIWIPKQVTLDNFRDITRVINFREASVNSIKYSIMPTFIQIFVCMMVGYGFARFRFPGKNIIFGAVILTIIVPFQTISTGLYTQYAVFNPLGVFPLLNRVTGGLVPGSINLIGSIWAMILPATFGTALRSGIYIFIFRQFFASMPRELEEAARVDGSGPFHTFVRIMVPNAVNIALTVLMLGLVWNWNDYYTPATFIRGDMTISMALHTIDSIGWVMTAAYMEGPNVLIPRIQSGLLIGIAPLLIMYLLLQRRLAESIENAGLTGM